MAFWLAPWGEAGVVSMVLLRNAYAFGQKLRTDTSKSQFAQWPARLRLL
jgi:hypothetical protein